MITPEEFVAAGDYLVYHCPTWSWSVYKTDKSWGWMGGSLINADLCQN